MPSVWLPGAHVDPGANADYVSGRSSMDRAVAHYTVGADSRTIARRGFFHFLVHQDASREGGCTQYAEVDAVTWHAADVGNPYGPGIEYERQVIGPPGPDGISEAEPLTANQVEWGRRLVAFLAEWMIPPALYQGPRYGAGNWRGWVNHRDLDPSRSDGLTRAEWDLIVATPTIPDDLEDDEMVWIADTDNRFALLTSAQFIEGLPAHAYEGSTIPKLDHLAPAAYDNIRDDLRARVPIVEPGRG